MMRINFFLSFLTVFFGGNQSFSQAPDTLIKEFMNEGKVPGVFVAVVKNDSVLFEKAYGVADIVKRTPVTNKTCMELGSISKAFTDEAILYLYHQHLLDLDDPITKYLPDAPSRWSVLTIRNLMDHTSGIREYLSDPRFMADAIFNSSALDETANFFLNRISTDSMVRMFYSLPLEFSPGATWSYSNPGYYLLGKIGERVLGKDFFDLVNEVLFVPLKMSQTKANELASAEGCLLQGYFQSDRDDIKPSRVLTSNYAFSAGAWATSGQDMINYIKSIHLKTLPSDNEGYDWRNYNPEKILPFTYHLGRFYSSYHGKHIFLHNGGTPGFSSSWIYVKEDTISIIVLANRQDYAPIDPLAWNILAWYDSSLYFPTDTLNGEEERKYERMINNIVKAIQENKPFPKGLSEPLRMLMESESGRSIWKWIFERGFPKTNYCVDTEIIGKTKAYRFRLPLNSKVEYRLTAIINEKNELAQLLWW